MGTLKRFSTYLTRLEGIECDLREFPSGEKLGGDVRNVAAVNYRLVLAGGGFVVDSGDNCPD
jgi:hypothetical protein